MNLDFITSPFFILLLSRRFVAGRVAAALAYLLLEFFVAGLSKPCPVLLLY